MLRSSQMFRRQASTKPYLPRSMLGFPIPVEAYPLFGIVAVMLSYATYASTKHIRNDQGLRWLPGLGNQSAIQQNISDAVSSAAAAAV
ncbi:hypothetical protein EHS25_007044 [Saitozyma podzolica]|uniref:Uncharacterized protein n=1 Tax=Saitozyma podzolica TaxID=1890683 RepID=A0A427XPW6_9TREE|nr:hypothetical protein EHS25_007044 [Saitozyma podzolica]